MEVVKDQPAIEKIFPASWISANFDVWIGDAEDVRSWTCFVMRGRRISAPWTGRGGAFGHVSRVGSAAETCV